ncbi:MAG: SDR family oxidoreductase [Pseudomonadota bacterium]
MPNTIIWITGAKGFIGRHLALYLANLGHKVYGIGHGLWPSVESATWGLEGWINGEIDASNLEVLRQTSGIPDVVFHLAGGSSVGSSLANPWEDFSRTVTTTARLVEWLRISAPDARLVAVSSAAVYGAEHSTPIKETSPPQPFSPYGHHKLMMEQVCRSYSEAFGLRCTTVRLFSVYGPWLRKQLLWDVCCKLAGGAKVLQLGGSGGELRDWVEIRDVVRLLGLAGSINGDDLVLLNGGSGIGTSVAMVAALIVDAWGEPVPIEFTGEGRRGDPFSLVACTNALASNAFTCEIGLAAGIANYVRWFKEVRI